MAYIRIEDAYGNHEVSIDQLTLAGEVKDILKKEGFEVFVSELLEKRQAAGLYPAAFIVSPENGIVDYLYSVGPDLRCYFKLASKKRDLKVEELIIKILKDEKVRAIFTDLFF